MGKLRNLFVETLEERRVLTASFGWDGPGAGSAELTYHIANAPPSLSQSEVNEAIETALDAWSDVVDVNFTPTNQSGLRDSLDFSFTSLDGGGGTLAQAYFPDDVNPARIAGDIQFDTSESWEVGNSLGRRAFDLVSVAVHEIGHALGLDHLDHGDSILAPTISPNASFSGLSEHDVEAIQALYAPAISTSDPGIDAPAADSPQVELLPVANDADTPAEENNGRRSPWSRFRWSIFTTGVSFRWRGFGGLAAGEAAGHNNFNPTDVNQDDITSPVDALLVINSLNSGETFEDMVHLCDTNNDGALSAVDALMVINRLNVPEGETGDQADDPADDDDDMLDSDALDSDALDSDTAGEEAESDDSDEEGSHVHDDHLHEDDFFGDRLPRFFAGLGLGIGGRPGMLRDDAIDRLFEAFDENGDMALVESEVPQFAWDFMIEEGVDADSNGSITMEEVDAAILAVRQEQFDNRDADGNGLLDASELPDRVFDRLANADTNEDGGISFDELEAFRALSRFERLDANGDEQISEDEVTEFQWNRLLRRDANEDGVITEDELIRRNDNGERFSRLADLAARVFRFVRSFR